MEYISQLKWYSTACISYHDFLDSDVVSNKEATESVVPCSQVEVITSKGFTVGIVAWLTIKEYLSQKTTVDVESHL